MNSAQLRSVLAAIMLVPSFAATQTITTVAGGGGSGDGGPAVEATLNFPAGLALAAGQNIYVADETSNTIRKIDRVTGVITPVIGSGIAGFTEDGTPALDAKLNNPVGVAIDRSGNVFVADRLNHRIRKLDASTQTVSTVAGTGDPGFGGDGGPAKLAQLKFPVAVATNRDGDIFVADQYNHRIRKVSAANGIITTVAGTGTAGYNGDGKAATASNLNIPSGVYVDAAGGIFVADKLNQRVRRVDPSTTLMETVAGTGSTGYAGDGGLATSATFWNPAGITRDWLGNVYIVDEGNGVLRRIDWATRIVTTIAGSGAVGFSGDNDIATKASFNMTTGLSTPGLVVDAGGTIFLADRGNQRIRKIDAATQIISTYAGGGPIGDGLRARKAHLVAPPGITKDAVGNLYIADRGNNVIRKVDAVTYKMSTIAGAPGRSGYSGDGGPAIRARCNLPISLVWDDANQLYIVEEGNHVVRRIDLSSGVISTIAGTGKAGYGGDGLTATSARLRNPHGIALDGAKNIYISDSYNNLIRKVDAITGIISRVAGNGAAGRSGDNGPAVDAMLNTPYNITIEGSALYIADFGNNSVRRVGLNSGVIRTVAGTGIPDYSGDGGLAVAARLWHPSGIDFDSTGAMYIADYGNNVVRRVDPITKFISTVVGTGVPGFGGDGGLSAAALLNLPVNVFIDGADHLYINDVANNRIRMVF